MLHFNNHMNECNQKSPALQPAALTIRKLYRHCMDIIMKLYGRTLWRRVDIIGPSSKL